MQVQRILGILGGGGGRQFNQENTGVPFSQVARSVAESGEHMFTFDQPPQPPTPPV